MSSRVILQLWRIMAWLSQGVNCLLLGGHHDQTVSARAWIGRARWHWAALVYVLDGLFLLVFRQRDHCRKSFEADVLFAREIYIHYDSTM
jgi:hypothetical protein